MAVDTGHLLDEETLDRLTLPIPTADGHKADKLVLAFGGSIELDRTDEDDLELINSLELGGELEFVVEGAIGGKVWSQPARAEDGTTTTTYRVGIRINSCQRA